MIKEQRRKETKPHGFLREEASRTQGMLSANKRQGPEAKRVGHGGMGRWRLQRKGPHGAKVQAAKCPALRAKGNKTLGSIQNKGQSKAFISHNQKYSSKMFDE